MSSWAPTPHNYKTFINIFSGYPYIFNLGHGILPETDPTMIEFVVKMIREKK